MVTTADFVVFQQQLRQEMTDVIQQLRTEMNEKVNGRMDMLNSINTALQNVSARPPENKPYRISDLIPRNWEGNNEKGEFRSFIGQSSENSNNSNPKKIVEVTDNWAKVRATNHGLWSCGPRDA